MSAVYSFLIVTGYLAAGFTTLVFDIIEGKISEDNDVAAAESLFIITIWPGLWCVRSLRGLVIGIRHVLTFFRAAGRGLKKVARSPKA